MDKFVVLDHFYTEEEGKDVFEETYEECTEYVRKESELSTMFEIVPEYNC